MDFQFTLYKYDAVYDVNNDRILMFNEITDLREEVSAILDDDGHDVCLNIDTFYDLLRTGKYILLK